MIKELIGYLSQFTTENRYSLFQEVLNKRTRYMTVVLENIYQPHNASAVLRSCDCFGVQNVHVIENDNEYQINPDVALGSAQWLTLKRHKELENNTLSAISKLKDEGYRIVATTPHNNDVNLDDFDISKGKFALMFGSERPGLSDIAMDAADEFLKIPMFGFTESFNISVSAAIILNRLRSKINDSDIPWQLTDAEADVIMLDWLRGSIKKSKLIERKFMDLHKYNAIKK